MFGKGFELNEYSMQIVKEMGSHMPGGFFIYKADINEELLYVNDAAIRIFGCDDLEDFKAYTGNSFRGMLHPEDVNSVEDAVADQVRKSDDNVDHVEYRIIRKDGQIRWIDDYGHYSESENYGGLYYVFISDITEKRDQALSEALEAAVKANEAKTAFLSSMSHEIRTPMNAIIGLDSLALKKDNLDAETRG